MKILITIFLLLASQVHADVLSENNFTLRAGFSFNLNHIETDRLIDNSETEDDGKLEDETKTFGYGLVTSIAYKFNDWEFAFASDVLFGKIKDVSFIYQESSIRGGGHFRLVSIGPQIKYHTPYTIFNKATVYVGVGPSWSLQTFVFKNPYYTGNFNDKRRVSFENYGGGIFIGLQEIQAVKENHPMFIEVGYSYMHSYKVSLLDSTDSADVITLSEGDSNDFSGQYLFIRAGFTLF